MTSDDGRCLGYVHSMDSGAGVDGPGMRFAVFLSGCQFRCLYCHNPDTRNIYNGDLRTVDDVLAELGKYAPFLRRAGGLTVSGGEPLMQAPFVHEIMRRAKEELDLHTALDTQGFLAAHLDDTWFENIDLVLLDIKHIKPDRYLELTGKPLAPTIEFARRLARLQKPVWIRYVLVPGYSDDEKDVGELADFLSELANVERVEVLRFHKMGEFKWKKLGYEYKLGGVTPPSQKSVEIVRGIFRSRGLKTC